MLFQPRLARRWTSHTSQRGLERGAYTPAVSFGGDFGLPSSRYLGFKHPAAPLFSGLKDFTSWARDVRYYAKTVRRMLGSSRVGSSQHIPVGALDTKNDVPAAWGFSPEKCTQRVR